MSDINRPTRRRGPLLAVLLTLLATLALLSASVGGAAAQTAANATTATPEAGGTGCHPDGPPPIERTWIHLEDERVAAGDPGKIAFQHNVRTSYDCPVTVIATIYAPDGVELKMSSGGTVSQMGGAAQAIYRIDPTTGSTLDGSAIEVYYDGPVDGTKRIDVDATAQLFPDGHRDEPALHTEVGGLSKSLVVTERTTPATQTGGNDGDGSADSTGDGGPATATPTPASDGSAEASAATATPRPGHQSDPPIPRELPSRLTMLALIALVALVAVVGAVRSD